MPPPLPPEPSEADDTSRWREMATAAQTHFRARLERLRSVRWSPRERDRLARRLGEAIDAALDVPPDLASRLAEDAARLRARNPDTDPVALAWRRVRERARATAAVGAVTTAPAMVPGVGSALAALGLVADWKYVAEQQRDLVVEVAALLGVPLEDPAREVRALFLASTGTSFGAARAGEMAVEIAARRIAERSAARLVPGLGGVISGALNYLATLALGRAAIGRFAPRAGLAVEGIIPTGVHPALPRLRQSVVAAVRIAALGDGMAPVFTAQQREVIAALSAAEREELLDLAVVSAVAEDAAGDEDADAVLRALARELGLAPEALADARAAAAEDATRYAARFRRLIGSTRATTRALRTRWWRRARRLARRESGKSGEKKEIDG